MKILRFLVVACAIATCSAVETRFWEQGERADFEKGTLSHLSLRSDGRVYLAPAFQEVFDSSTPYLWTIASDSKGNLYTAGGGSGSGTAKLFRVDAAGKSRTFTGLDGLEIHAIVLDSKDQVYAATDPDGKIYKISADGKSRVFFDPHQKYIWAMVFNRKGDLFVATGEQGEIYRVTPDGTGSLFFKTEETHARSLAVDAQDNLVVGTEPSGLILRVSPSGQGFVLYQSPKREITAVAVDSAGAIYAAGAGNKNGAVPGLPQLAPVTPIPSALPSVGGNITVLSSTAQHSSMLGQPLPAIAGGSDVYRIDPDGSPRRAWSNNQDIVYAIAFDAQGRPLLGTGNRGRIYRLDSDSLSTELIDASPTQVTSFGKGAHGELYAVTANIGKLYRLGPGLEQHGTFESEVLDAGSFSYWGRISYRGTGAISVFTRAGNLNHPESNWSPWAALQPDASEKAICDSCGGGRSVSPAARFLQYKIDIGSPSASPLAEVSSVEVAYLPKNVAPVVEEIEITPPNYRFPPNSLTVTPSTSITLPVLGQRRSSTQSSLDISSSQSMNYAKGYLGARWLASDENGDTLAYKLEIRGVNESTWQLLKDDVKDKYWSWDSSAFPDGEYVLRITGSDAPSNPRDHSLSASLVSDPFLIDNTPPQILNLAASVSGNKVSVHWTAHDARSNIDKAEYSVNGGDWLLAEPVNKLTDSPEEDYRLEIDRTAGEQVIAVRVTDEFDNQTVDKAVVK